jgi:hypothetical protein
VSLEHSRAAATYDPSTVFADGGIVQWNVEL